MQKSVKTLLVVVFIAAILLTLSPATSQALPPDTWNPGDEAAIFGHTFTEHYWTNDSVTVTTEKNHTVQFIASYVNYSASVGSFQAMLIALGIVEDENGTQSTLPYQLFGLHFTTPQGRDIFVGALFAFLYAYNDTNDDGLPNPTEDRWFVVPYGYNDGNGSAPVVTAITATNPAPGHYRFGITYENLYARIVAADDGFWWSLLLPILEVTFSELTIIYDIQVDTATGEIQAQSKYTIGQIDEALLLGIPIADPQQYLEGIGVGAAHFVVVFASEYHVQEGSTTPVNATDWVLANVTTDAEGRYRAFAVGMRGTYDIIDEDTGTPIAEDLAAYAWVLSPKLSDLFLIAWQLPFSAHVYSVFAWAMSEDLQAHYPSPQHLYNSSASEFNTAAFWYGIAFPDFGGYRVEHDPVYTAYSNIGQATPPSPGIPGFPFEAILLGVMVCLLAVFLVRRRKRATL